MTCSSARLIISMLRKMPSCFSRERSGNIFPPKI
jgi:predicted transcriptional regulator